MNTRLNPYLGPRSFETGDTLYGRDRELRQLEALLVAERIVLLHSPSGAGKTSLIRAGLIPQMREDFLILPPVRVNREPPTDGEPLNRYLWSTLLSLEENLPEAGRRSEAELASLSLDAYLRTRPREVVPDLARGPDSAPDVELLIFDQFEEILTTAPADQEAKHTFFAQLAAALKERNRWALFAVREDYLGALAPYLRPMPNRLKTTYRLDLLKTDAAREAIQRPARAQGVTFSESAADQLVRDLSRIQTQDVKGATREEQGEYVEPVQLQVVCFNLWQNLKDDENEINAASFSTGSSVDESLAQYYADIVARVSAQTGASEREMRAWFDKKLLTGPADQPVRGQVRKGEGSTDGLDNSALDELVNAHIIRAEPRAGSTWYELAHDRLIQPVRRSNRRWFERTMSAFQRRTELWKQQGKPDDLLLRGRELEMAEIKARETRLTTQELAFIQSSQVLRARIRRNRLIAVVFAVGFVVSLMLVVMATYDPVRREVLRQQAIKGEMVAISAGHYPLGNRARTAEQPNWYWPLQPRYFSAFSIDKNPVTNYRYGLCIQAGICSRPNAQKETYEGDLNAEKPVVNLTALGAAQFCNWLGQHLPSDRQWETAMRLDSSFFILLRENKEYQQDNFFEWTSSPYDQNESEWMDVSKDPPQVLTKKGGYIDAAPYLIATFRLGADSNIPNNTTGFRCVVDR